MHDYNLDGGRFSQNLGNAVAVLPPYDEAARLRVIEEPPKELAFVVGIYDKLNSTNLRERQHEEDIFHRALQHERHDVTLSDAEIFETRGVGVDKVVALPKGVLLVPSQDPWQIRIPVGLSREKSADQAIFDVRELDTRHPYELLSLGLSATGVRSHLTLPAETARTEARWSAPAASEVRGT